MNNQTADLQTQDNAQATNNYVEPAYPTCPAGTSRFTFAGELLNTSAGNRRSHSFDLPQPHTLTSLTVLKMEGHPESGCRAGLNNDNGRFPCDQNQPNEGFTIAINNEVYATVEDNGPEFDDDWSEHTFSTTVNLPQGSNTVTMTHIGGEGIGSVEYKGSICYTSTTAATPTPTPTVTPSPTPSLAPTASPSPTVRATATPTLAPTATPAVGGPVTTPQPTATVRATATPTVTPSPTQAAQTTSTGGDGRSDGLGCAENDCSGNVVNQAEANKAVAQAGTQASAGTTASTLPDAGIPGGIYMLIAGALFLGSGALISRQRIK